MDKSGVIYYIYNMINIVGTYECKIDIKGRVNVPSAIKKQLATVIHEKFILKRSVFSNCIEIHPNSEWKKIMKQIDKLNRFSRKNNTFIRTYLSGLKEVELDANFRILIPKDLMIFANLKKDIVFSSSLNMIEVWSKDNYEKSIKSSLNNFPDLVEDVMGGPEKDE